MELTTFPMRYSMYELFNDCTLLSTHDTLHEALEAFIELVNSGDMIVDAGIWCGEVRWAELDLDGQIRYMGE